MSGLPIAKPLRVISQTEAYMSKRHLKVMGFFHSPATLKNFFC